MITTKSRAHRTLRHLQNFSMSAQDAAEELLNFGVTAEVDLIGIYRNTPPTQPYAIVIAENYIIFLYKSYLLKIEYIDIENVHIKEEQKLSAINLVFQLHNKEIIVPINGGDSRTRDVYEILRFIMRVQADRRSAGCEFMPRLS